MLLVAFKFTNCKMKYIEFNLRKKPIFELILRVLILRKAFIGYSHYVTENDKNAQSSTFSEFATFDFWKIKFGFIVYLQRVRNFENVPFDTSDKTIFLLYLKYLFK